MLNNFALGAVMLVALAHFGFMILEGTLWSSKLGAKLTNLDKDVAEATSHIGKNMAIYNGFVGFILFWATFALREREAYSAQWVILSFVAFAGIFGAISIRNPGIFVFQCVPALVALGLIWAARPYARDDEQAARQIIEIERQILTLKSVDPAAIPDTARGAVPRGQHPKVLGLVKAEFIISEGLPDHLKVGLFKDPGKVYDAWVRYSNARNLDDREAGGHGMAIKLLDARDGTEHSPSSQDFVLFDSPAFFVGNPVQYVEFEEAVLRAYGRSKFETLCSTFLNYYWRHPRHLMNLMKAQRKDVTDPLAIRYWSVTPYKWGESAVKYSAKPVGPDAKAVVGDPSRDMLREAMKVHLARTGQDHVEFEFQVQVQSDPDSMPIEDPTKVWDEDVAGPKTVARLRIPMGQPFDTPERDLIAENLTFTPWNALPEHAPLGGINFVRKKVYESLTQFRHALNQVPLEEPRSLPKDR